MKKTIFAALALSTGAVWACDICATHVALGSWVAPHKASISLFEQYSKYDATPEGEQAYESSTTQLGLGYRFSDRWAVQFTAPYVYHELGDEMESGLGDVTLIGIYRIVNAATDVNVAFVEAYAGLKLPTGNSDPLKEDRDVVREEAEEQHHDDAGADSEEHHHAGGHHLALGSGSWDGLLGARGIVQRAHWYGSTEAQYVARTEGDYDYQYGNELIARIGARYLAVLSHEWRIAVGADLVREWSDNNQVLGESRGGTGKSAAYVGPAVDVTLSDRMTVSVVYDVAIEGKNDGVSGAADQRVRASLDWLF